MLKVIKDYYTEAVALFMFLLFILQITFVAVNYEYPFLKALIVLSLVLCIPFLCKVRKVKLHDLSKTQILCVIFSLAFICFRVAAVLIYKDFYSMKFAVSLEFILLILINGVAFSGMKHVDLLFKTMVIIMGLLCFFSIVINYMRLHGFAEWSIIGWLDERYLINHCWSSLFKNDNPPANLMAICMILAYNVFNRKRPFLYIYWAFGLFFIYLTECRTAFAVLIVVAAVYFVQHKKWLTMKKCLIIILLFCVAFTGGIFAFAEAQYQDNKLMSLNSTEEKLDSVMAGRYRIWKFYSTAFDDNIFIGNGSLTSDKVTKWAYANDLEAKGEINMDLYTTAKRLGPHNGYLAIYFIAGLVPLLLFLAFLVCKILTANEEVLRRYGPVVVYLLFFSLIEAALIVSVQCFAIFMSLLVLSINKLEWKEDEGEKNESI